MVCDKVGALDGYRSEMHVDTAVATLGQLLDLCVTDESRTDILAAHRDFQPIGEGAYSGSRFGRVVRWDRCDHRIKRGARRDIAAKIIEARCFAILEVQNAAAVDGIVGAVAALFFVISPRSIRAQYRDVLTVQAFVTDIHRSKLSDPWL